MTRQGFPLRRLPDLVQRVQVTFRYRVLFTENVFAAENPLLAETLASIDADTPCHFLCVVEDGVACHRPGLVGSIQAYAARHREHITLVEARQVVPGGEQVKTPRSWSRQCRPQSIVAASAAIRSS